MWCVPCIEGAHWQRVTPTVILVKPVKNNDDRFWKSQQMLLSNAPVTLRPMCALDSARSPLGTISVGPLSSRSRTKGL